MVLSVAYFFLIIAYVAGFYLVSKWYNPTADKTVFFCLYFKNKPLTYLYFTWTNILLLMQSFFHACFHFNVKLQLFALILTTWCNFALLVKCYYIFESLVQFFVYLFHQVSRFLFLTVLFFHSIDEQEIFEIDIRITELVVLALLVVFVHLEVISNSAISLIRVFRKSKED